MNDELATLRVDSGLAAPSAARLFLSPI